MPRNLFLNLRMALYYVVGAQLGLLLVPQDDTSATLLWAPSGIALGMLLLRGSIVLPGLYLGAFVLVGLVTLPAAPPLVALLASLVASIGVTLAYFGASKFLRIYAPSAPIWASAKDLLAGSIVMGLACTFSSTFGMGLFYGMGLLTADTLISTMSAWWLGEFLGMVIFTPLVYTVGHRVWKGDWHPSKATEIISPTIVYSLFAIAALISFLALWNIEGTAISNSLRREANIVADRLMQVMRIAGRDLESVRALVVSHNTLNDHELSNSEFLTFTATEFENRQGYPGIQAVGWAPKVTDPRDWELKALAKGMAGASLFELDATGKRVSVQKRADYFPIQLIYPMDDVNRTAIGFDLGSERVRRSAIERARDTGELSMMGPIYLVQSEGRAPGMLLCWPIYREGEPLDTLQMRRAAFIGVASGVYHLATVFDAAMSEFDADIALHLLDNALPEEGHWYHTRPSPLQPTVEPSSRAPTLARLTKGFHGLAPVSFAGQEWSIIAIPGPTYVAASRTWIPWALLSLVLAVGIGISSIMIERIAARRRLEEERDRTVQALHEARAANESKSFFMAAASHDIKQPLYALSILTDTLLMSKPPEEMRPIVKKLSQSIKEMSKHFDTLMDVGRFQDGSFEVNATTFALSELSPRIAQEIGPLCREKGLRWTINFDDAEVLSDPELLLRLIRNLLINAVRYTNRGGVSCIARARGDTVEFRISDTGSGLSPDQQKLLFQETEQVHKDVLHATGFGLGLSIVRKISLALNLGMEMSSTSEEGTTYTFRLPVAQRK